MKTLLVLAILSLLASCSSTRLERKISDASWDLLGDESFLRWSEVRLQKKAGVGPKVISCYQGETQEALETYRLNYLEKQQRSDYWLHIGNCYFLNDQWAKAEFFYRLSLENAKSNSEKALAFNNLAMIEFKFEQWEKGRDYLRQSILSSAQFRVPQFNLSQIYIQFGLFDKAIEVLSGPLFRDSKDVDVYFSLANAYLYKGDLARSGHFFELLPKEQFRREDIAASYALYLIKQNKIQAAKTIMDDRDRSHVIMVTEISQKIEKLIAFRLKEE